MSDFETLIGLVSQYSPSGQERNAVEWLVARMKSLGYNQAFSDEAGNAVGVMGSGPKQVVLLGHIDTVPGEIEVRRDGIPPHEVLFGRGTVDAKGPLACFVDAVKQVGIKAGWQFVVVGAVEEERDSEGARFVASHYKPDFAIIGEPNRWDRIALGYKGSAWANVTVRHGQTHTASGERTAVEAAVEMWLAIKSFAEAFNAEKRRAFDHILPTLRGMISGQDEFAQWAQLNVGARLPVNVSPEDWYSKLNEILDDSHIQSDCHLLVERMGFAVPAWKCEKNTALVRAFLHGIRSQSGEPTFVYKMGTADLNIVAPVWQCPAVVYGPGDSVLDHTPHECIELAEYEKAVKSLTTTLSALILAR